MTFQHSGYLKGSYWFHLSSKIKDKILHPRAVGFFSKEAYLGSTLRVVTGIEGSFEEGLFSRIDVIVDESDGVIADVKYQAFGPPPLIAALEALSEIALRKNYAQASRITYELIDKHLRDSKDLAAFPLECFTYVNFALSAFSLALEQCEDISIDEDQLPPPVPFEGASEGGVSYPEFGTYSDEEKYKILEEVIQKDIRPYIELDAGGIIIKKIDGFKVTITYQGSCTSCYSATGATLNAIQQLLKAKVHEAIVVIPDLSVLTHGQGDGMEH